jgi:sugar phosphate isomerase/epimerase
MNDSVRPRLSASTWSLHRALGVTYPDSPGQPNSGPTETYGQGTITLLEIPARLASMGIHTLEICHFHLPSRDNSYANELRDALNSAGVELFSLLIDDGDITHAEHSQRDLEWITRWIEIAGLLGARRARVIAGKAQPSEQAIERSISGLTQLAAYGATNNVRVMTENWHGLLSTPEAVRHLLEVVDIGLCADFGNWGGPAKYDNLAAIFPLAESCHAKCAFSAAGQPDREDFGRCLDLARAANFSGPYTLIYDGSGADEWAGLAIEREMVQPYLN